MARRKRNSMISGQMSLFDLMGEETLFSFKGETKEAEREKEMFYPLRVIVNTVSILWERAKAAYERTKDISRKNYRIRKNEEGAAGKKAAFERNLEALRLLKHLNAEERLATENEMETLAKYSGFGAIPEAFDENVWPKEEKALRDVLSDEEYRSARASTLTAFYTPPFVIRAIWGKLQDMGVTGNVLEPSCGIGAFMGLVPEDLDIRMYGVELDAISGRICRQLYQKNDIRIEGFESSTFPDNFFTAAIGNVPFGEYSLPDKKYDRYHFLIHDYFFAKALDLVAPGGVIAFLTSKGTMDKAGTTVRAYLAKRAELLGAVRLPDNTFTGTKAVSDILFLRKREVEAVELPSWVETGVTEDGFRINRYFLDHPEMVLGALAIDTGYAGRTILTVKAEGDTEAQLKDALHGITGSVRRTKGIDGEKETAEWIEAIPSVKNFSYCQIQDTVYYRENDRMRKMQLPLATERRVKGLIALREIVRELLDAQLQDDEERIALLQLRLGMEYDVFVKKNGYITSNANRRAFQGDSSYSLLSALEVLDEKGNVKEQAAIFTKRTIRKATVVTHCDTAVEALAVSIGEKAGVDLAYMSELTGKPIADLLTEARDVIFRVPGTDVYQTADEYLSGNVREKLKAARIAAQRDPEYLVNAAHLEKVLPKDLGPSEIDVRLGAPWIKEGYINQFMGELFETSYYLLGSRIYVKYIHETGQWHVEGKNHENYNIHVNRTYGTERANGYRLLEDALNLKDTKIYDPVEGPDGKEHRVLNRKETMLAQQKQQLIKEAFKSWIYRDVDRREDLVRTYNEKYNSIRPREYDGSHINFVGMNPEISLMDHQKNAVAHVLYGGNTLLAHVVGAGKTYEMAAAAMESKRLGLCRKSLFVVPNHLTEQWGAEFMRLYPEANILVARKTDFEPKNRKRFISRIAMGTYDAVIIGHTQFEKIPLTKERRARYLQEEIEELTDAIDRYAYDRKERFTVKQLEKTRKKLTAKLERLNDEVRKDDVIYFEQLGVDRLFVDESHYYKNAYIYTKMSNVAGIATADAQKSADMMLKCRYLDEVTGGRGITFATGTPVSNSMCELYIVMRYLMRSRLEDLGLTHFDAWAATFGETVTAIELAPEGTGYRARTRFSRFYNLPELMCIFKECADVKTADTLSLDVPNALYVNEQLEASEEQRAMVEDLSERADLIRSGGVDPREDNMLKITSDGRKAALDQRIMNEMLPDAEESKVNRCVENVFVIYGETSDERLTQLIFCDQSTPKGDGKFNVYDDIRKKLVERGVPKAEVAFIHEAKTDTQKAALFAKVRAGEVRVLIGSTSKMGTGTNCQDKLVAVHHLDAPYRPADIEQRDGRIIRQGNRNKDVTIYRYVTKGTFDAYMWQMLEAKQKFIGQIMTSKSAVRSCEDVDESTLSYAEVKALCTGNPYIKEKMDLDIQVARLKLLKSNYDDNRWRMESDLARKFPEEMSSLKALIEGYDADLVTAKGAIGEDVEFAMTVKTPDGDTAFDSRKEAGMALLAACEGLKDEVGERKVAEYCGFIVTAYYDHFSMQKILNVRGRCSYRTEMGKDPVGNIRRIQNLIEDISHRKDAVSRKLQETEAAMRQAEAELQKPFREEAELREKQQRLAELNALLNLDACDVSEAGLLDDEEEEAAS